MNLRNRSQFVNVNTVYSILLNAYEEHLGCYKTHLHYYTFAQVPYFFTDRISSD